MKRIWLILEVEFGLNKIRVWPLWLKVVGVIIMLMVDGGIGGDDLTIAFKRTPTNMY